MNQTIAAADRRQAAIGRSSMKLQALIIRVVSHVVLILAVLVIVYPVFWMYMGSLKSGLEMASNVWGLPRTLTWQNYPRAWERGMLGPAFLNSVLVASGTVILINIAASLAGYAFAKLEFRFAMPLFLLFVFTMQAGAPIVPLYVMLVKMNLTNTRLGLIFPEVAGGLPLSIFIFRAFFQGIPGELIDAAKVDGCTEFHAFLRVIVPISGPAVATVSILQFLGAWNNFTLPLILVRTPEMRTLPLTIQAFQWEFGRTDWALVFAALTIGSLPMIVLYVIMQRQFIQGLTSGALKG
ncbi:MAG: carbohydrate ABC transporter permease [Chloroflexi bacterium]|nr:carbohydrate ABC transporter permease [Chloroflexota bacterium]